MRINFFKKATFSLLIPILSASCISLSGCGTGSNNAVPAQGNNQIVSNNNESENSSNTNTTGNVSNTSTRNAEEQTDNAPKFEKTVLPQGTKAAFASPWKSSAGGTYSACIVGKGVEVKEEGIGKIYIRNNKGDIYSFKLSENTKKYTPKFLEWWDEENLLIVVGYGYGTVSAGGNLYCLNVSTGKSSTIYETADKKHQVLSAAKTKEITGEFGLMLKVLVYEDDNYMKSHTEDIIIPHSSIKI